MASIIIQKSKADKRFDVLNLFVMSLLLLIMLPELFSGDDEDKPKKRRKDEEGGRKPAEDAAEN